MHGRGGITVVTLFFIYTRVFVLFVNGVFAVYFSYNSQVID